MDGHSRKAQGLIIDDQARSSGQHRTRPRILIIDDDERLNALLTEYFARFGLAVRACAHPDDGLRLLKVDPPDLVVLDIMLPDIDGLTVCRKVRDYSRVPIIMLTARGNVADRIVGLELGADDYLSKPFEPRELVARIQAVLRRGAPGHEEVDRAGALEMNWTTRLVSLHGRTVPLTTTEFELLGLLMRNRGRVLSRERIIEAMRGFDWESYDRSVDVLVSRVRQKLGDDARQATFIRTVRGVGYSFAGDGDG